MERLLQKIVETWMKNGILDMDDMLRGMSKAELVELVRRWVDDLCESWLSTF